MNSRQTKQPVFYIPHGAGPCFFMDWNPANTWEAMGSFLKHLADDLPQRPRALVVVSGHWLAPRFMVTGHQQPELIYDYYNFPPHTYELTYPAPGDPELAQQMVTLLEAQGLGAGLDPQRGFDHGVFIPLKLVFPKADIPVVQLSLRQDMGPKAHLLAGKALAPLREDNVLIIGSGMSFHHMRAYGDPRYTAPSEVFDEWLTQAVASCPSEREERLSHWSQAPHAYDCHPQGAEEHLMPLLVAAGAGTDGQGRKIYSERVMQTVISAFRFD